jgi:hypothetical protein
MAKEEAKRGGGKLVRTETVTVRLDPKLRYLAELAARLHRRTLSSYIEWAINSAVMTEAMGTAQDATVTKTDTLGDAAAYLWDVDEADRFAMLALCYPDLLTHDEQVRWKLIRENGYLWRGSFRSGPEKEWGWSVDAGSLYFERLREHWTAFCKVAEIGTGVDTLPTWPKIDPAWRRPMAQPIPPTEISAVGRNAPLQSATPPAKIAPRRASAVPASMTQVESASDASGDDVPR